MVSWRRLVACLALATVGLALAGCGLNNASAGPPVSGSGSMGSMAGVGTRALIGTWTVSGDGVESGTSVRFGRDLQVGLPCGVGTGTWLASDTGGLVAFITSLPTTCVPAGAPDAATALTPPWMLRVAGVRGLPTSALLVDASGDPVALLRRPADQDDLPDRGEAEQNVISTAEGVGLAPIDRDDVVGTWALNGAAEGVAPVTFDVDGSWTSTSCQEAVGGRWVVSTAEPTVLLMPNTFAGLQFCDGSRGVDALVGGVTIGEQAGSLVAVNQAGQVTGQFVRIEQPNP